MKPFLIGVAFAAGAATVDLGSFHSGAEVPPPQQQPALYSFVDVYRLTVAGAMAAFPPADGAPDAAIRVARAQGQAAEPRFTVSSVPPPDKWLLLLAGLALAGWVAHRRLVHSL